MVTTEDCKKEIVKVAEKEWERIRNEFDPVLPNEEKKKVINIKNWKRTSKNCTLSGYIKRGFDCRPFDDQLRAYTLDDGDTIIRCEVVTE